MRGQVIKTQDGIALLSGEDGQRYRLTAGKSAGDERMFLPGAELDFVPDEGFATDVVLVKKSAQEKSKYVAAFLAFLFGVFGADRFYLGWTFSGITTAGVLFSCLVVNAIFNDTSLMDLTTGEPNLLWKDNVQNLIWLAAVIWALCRSIAYLSKSEEQFYETYLSADAIRVNA